MVLVVFQLQVCRIPATGKEVWENGKAGSQQNMYRKSDSGIKVSGIMGSNLNSGINTLYTLDATKFLPAKINATSHNM